MGFRPVCRQKLCRGARSNDLSNVEIITWTEMYMHLCGGTWFAKHASGSPVALASNSRHIHRAACKAGIGVAILPCFLVDRDSELICLLAPERVASLDLWLITHRDLLRTARVRAVMDFMSNLISKTCRRGVEVGKRPSVNTKWTATATATVGLARDRCGHLEQ
jgi:DNA-binding transcriptional LysR family regulator